MTDEKPSDKPPIPPSKPVDDPQRQEAQLQLNVARDQLSAAEKQTTVESENKNRELIVTCILGVYVFTTCATALYVIFVESIGVKAAFTELADLIKVAVVPIVTLVIGYYFGSKQKDG